LTDHGAEIGLHAVEDGDTTWLDALIALYTELFPQYAYYAPLMRQRAEKAPDADPRWVQHQWLVTVNQAPAALLVFKYLTTSHLGVLLDVGVLPQFRNIQLKGTTRFAQYLYWRCLDKATTDAARLGHGRPLGLLAEVLNQELVRRYVSYGFVELPVSYFEPPGTPELEAIEPASAALAREWRELRLVFLPAALGADEAVTPDMTAMLVKSLLTEHYGLPYNHWALDRALLPLS
jgi:hypothetical protein